MKRHKTDTDESTACPLLKLEHKERLKLKKVYFTGQNTYEEKRNVVTMKRFAL
jgi:hypothetical protein